ncbi:MAG: hypothetical protein IJB22_06240, partial [Clostridia bacterium]|nr:hypothetical protein [Clostridia bacterium]
MFRNKEGNVAVGKIIAVVIVIILVVSAALGSFVVIPAGHTGVTVTFGKVSEQVLQEGIHFKVPFAQEIVQIDNRIVKLEVSTEAFSKDLQTVSTVLAVNYRIAKNMSYSIYKEVGAAFEEVLVTPAVNEALKAVVAQYTASDLVSSRSEVSVRLDSELNEKLNARGIYVEDLNIIDWDFSPEYIAAVEAKQVAEQNLIKTKTEQEQQIVIAEAEAQKQVIAAEAEAKSALITAEAEAERIKIEAEAQAEANRILAGSVTEELIDYETVVNWDGKLPSVVLGENGGSPLVSVG